MRCYLIRAIGQRLWKEISEIFCHKCRHCIKSVFFFWFVYQRYINVVDIVVIIVRDKDNVLANIDKYCKM